MFMPMESRNISYSQKSEEYFHKLCCYPDNDHQTQKNFSWIQNSYDM